MFLQRALQEKFTKGCRQLLQGLGLDENRPEDRRSLCECITMISDREKRAVNPQHSQRVQSACFAGVGTEGTDLPALSMFSCGHELRKALIDTKINIRAAKFSIRLRKLVITHDLEIVIPILTVSHNGIILLNHEML
jgi:hypothetical protein